MNESMLNFDREHIWHPYTSMLNPLPVYPVESASGVRIRLADGQELIDGMSSWWCAIHGYGHKVLNDAAQTQIEKMPHIMFGGITHEPAVELCRRLVELSPTPLNRVFLCDSGSVAVEVAMKMAIQYWSALQKPEKRRLLTVRGGYHGDTFAAMSVCDPVTGMHHIFNGAVQEQLFAPRPDCPFGGEWSDDHMRAMHELLEAHNDEIAAVILEPVVQGAGGMWFYSPQYLTKLRRLCNEYGALLIFDEIATGFGRTGKLFAAEHANVAPDIMCIGKSITGGFMSLAATLTNDRVTAGINQKDGGVLMHGPTFMGNPLACAVACASIDLLLSPDYDWSGRVTSLSEGLREGLEPCRELPGVADVRVLGAIGVVEMTELVDVPAYQREFVSRGVWIRPFSRLVYVMPPYIMNRKDLAQLTDAICDVVSLLGK